jgi:hypothetical protein
MSARQNVCQPALTYTHALMILQMAGSFKAIDITIPHCTYLLFKFPELRVFLQVNYVSHSKCCLNKRQLHDVESWVATK